MMFSWLNVHVVTAGDWRVLLWLICDGTYFCQNESFVMVGDTRALTMCCCESARVPLRFLKAFHAFRHISHEDAVCQVQVKIRRIRQKDFLQRKIKTLLAHSSQNTSAVKVFFFLLIAVQLQSPVVSQTVGWRLLLNLSWTSRHNVI